DRPADHHLHDHRRQPGRIRRLPHRLRLLSYELTTPPEPVTPRNPPADEGVRPALQGAGLVINPSGERIMLRLNPAGQCGFIEHATGAPLTAHLAALLTGAIR